MATSLKQRIGSLSGRLTAPTDSAVIHLQTLREATGYIALGLPVALVLGENLRDRLLPGPVRGERAIIETSISAYFHTGMREVFVGSLCAIALFLLCYKGYERRDNLAANLAGVCALAVALFPTPEPAREAGHTAAAAPGSVTLFSSAAAPDPEWVGVVHFGSAALFFVVLAVMSLWLFTLSDQPVLPPRKRQRNRVYVACGVVILACIVAIAAGKLLLDDRWAQRTSYVFWLETAALWAFGLSWLTKAEVLLGDDYPGLVRPPDPPGGPGPPRSEPARAEATP